MAIDTQSRRPLWAGEYAWVGSKKDGSLRVVIGPDPLETNEDDLWLVQDTDPTKVRIVQGPIDAIRSFTTLQSNQFAIITNPAANPGEDTPNGSWSRGRKEVTSLKKGTRRVITAGDFPLWPGQACEIKFVYRLLPNDYLIVQVVDANVDEKAPYYGVTVQCASVTEAVVDESNANVAPKAVPASIEELENGVAPTELKYQFHVGQRIRIPGNVTQNYIPPTGVEVVSDENHKETRQALVLGPTEFCTLIDRDGQPQRKAGPGRVFPGPYDRVQTSGSRNNGVYDAYHLRDDRGLLIRVVANQISQAELANQLPSGVKYDKPTYQKGDEIFVAGISAYLVPGNAIEIIDPESRLPQIGNNHDDVFVKAIGVDQKSGIYVSDVKTGSVELVRGEKSEVLDPRYKKHVRRSVPVEMWNLMIGHAAPHKVVGEDFIKLSTPRGQTPMIETPWALSIPVPNNEAILIISRSGRRAVVGPKMELLQFDETLQVLELSRGKPKRDQDTLATCFLKVDGNCVSDQIDLQTSDYVIVRVDVSYGVRFTGDTDEERAKWFNHGNYVKFFCDHLRSVLRAEARKLTMSELIGNVAEFVRDTILGEKPEEGHRSGKLFEENNMLVYEVEVLNWNLPDTEIGMRINQTNRNVVSRQLEDADKRNALESKRVQEEANAEIARLEAQRIERECALGVAEAEANSQIAGREHDLKHALAKRAHIDELALRRQKADVDEELRKRHLVLKAEESDMDDKIAKSGNAIIEAHEKAQTELEIAVAKAKAEADVARLGAVQPGLIEAITSSANSALASTVARHLPEAGGALGFLLGTGGIEALKKLVAGTPMASALDALSTGKTSSVND